MPTPTTYILDSNVFIEAKNRYYSFSICPGFWAALGKCYQLKRVLTIDKVRDELKRGKDNLYDWVSKMPKEFCESTDNDGVVSCYRELVKWATEHNQYFEEAKIEFISGVDIWLIAYAKATQNILVTQEIERKDKKNKIPIPNVCNELGITCIDTFKMLDELNMSFILS